MFMGASDGQGNVIDGPFARWRPITVSFSPFFLFHQPISRAVRILYDVLAHKDRCFVNPKLFFRLDKPVLSKSWHLRRQDR
jgi:hypothetical protein